MLNQAEEEMRMRGCSQDSEADGTSTLNAAETVQGFCPCAGTLFFAVD